jgi:hypothetical protein
MLQELVNDLGLVIKTMMVLRTCSRRRGSASADVQSSAVADQYGGPLAARQSKDGSPFLFEIETFVGFNS